MTFEAYVVGHVILLILSIAFIMRKQMLAWSELGVLAALAYSINGFYTFNFLKYLHYGDLGNVIVGLLAWLIILLSTIMVVLLVYHSFAEYGFMMLVAMLIGVVGLGYFLNTQYESAQKQANQPSIEAPLEPVSPDIETRNKMLEEGIDPNSHH